MKHPNYSLAILFLVGSFIEAAPTVAGDWPQILGKGRDGVAAGERLLDRFPEAGPESIWEYEVGEGYAGPAIFDGKVIVFHRRGNDDLVECLELASGKRVWRAELAAEYQAGINPDKGPRCVPLVAQDKVFVMSAGGRLACLDFKSGKKQWERQLFKEYRGDENYFGAGSSPLLVDGQLVVNVGGKRGAGIVAIAADTGETTWKATDHGTSYAAPIAIDWEGEKLAVVVTRLTTVGIRPTTGEVVFEYPFGQRGATVNAAMPLSTPEGLFLSSSYGVGARMLKLGTEEPEAIWSNDDSLSSQYFTSVYHDGFLYGVDGREDFRNTVLKCVDARTGDVVWAKDGISGGHVIRVGEQILLIEIEGGLRVFEANSSKYTESYSGEFLSAAGRALPALSNGHLVSRTNATGGRGTLKCVRVGK